MNRITSILCAVALLALAACGGDGATVTTLQSTTPRYSQTLTVSVFGFKLDSVALSMLVEGPCQNARATGTPSATQATFTCTVSAIEQPMVAHIRETDSGRELAQLRIDAAPQPRVQVSATDGTNTGSFTIALDVARAPLSVDNFLAYVNSGFYNGTIFHRVLAGFVVQGGGFDTNSNVKSATRDPIRNEASNGLLNVRGSIAMARTTDPDSATSQFFVNLVDNPALNPGGSSAAGYAVFGQVIDGMAAVDALGAVPVRSTAGFEALPVTQVRIVSALQTR